MASCWSCRTMACLLLVTVARVFGDSAGVTLAALNAEDGGADEAGISLLQLRAHRSREALVQALRAEAEAGSSEHALLRAEATEAVLSVAQAGAQVGAEADLGAEMTETEAQAICAQIPGCKGFTMQYLPTSDSPIVINLKDKEALLQVQSLEGNGTANGSNIGGSSSLSDSNADTADSTSAIHGDNSADSSDADFAQPTDTSASTESLSISKLLTTLTDDEEADNSQAESQSGEHLNDDTSELPYMKSSNLERSKLDKPDDVLDGVHSDRSPPVATLVSPKPPKVDASLASSDGQAWSLADMAQLLLREAKLQETHTTHTGSNADSGFGGRSLGEVAQEILRLAKVSGGPDNHSIRSADDAPHPPSESTSELANNALFAKPAMKITFEEVDGGEGRACRGLSKVDHSEMYFTADHADSLATCKELCMDAHNCVGLSFDSKALRCEVWRRPAYIGMSVADVHSYCLRYNGGATAALSATPEAAAVSETEPSATAAAAALDGPVPPDVPLMASVTTSDAPGERQGVSASFEAVDGGSGRSCRGASPTDHADQYYSAEKAKTLGECQETCIGKLDCVGVEYRSLSGRCEVWTRPAGIGASEEAANSECHRRLHIADTPAGLVKEEARPEAEEPSGSDIFQKIEKLGSKLQDRRDGTSDLMQELRAAAKELGEVEAEKKDREEAKAKLRADKREKRRLAKNEAEKAKNQAEKRAHTILPGDGAEKISSVIIGEVAKLGTKILDLQSNGAASSNGAGAAVFSEHVDYAFAGDDLGAQGSMTVEQAKKKCVSLSGCHGFSFQGSPASAGPVDVRFKSAWSAAGHGWSSFHLEVDHAAERKVREALANINAAELKASTDEPKAAEHIAQVSEAVLASQTSAGVPSNRTYEFEAVDGGQDRACRGQTASDSFGWYYDLNSAATLDECKQLCLTAPVCKGIEFNSEVGVCEVWTRQQGIGMTESAEGYQCHRLQAVQAKAPEVSETSLLGSVGKSSHQTAEVQKAWSDVKRLSLGFEEVDGGSGRACRGSANNDIKDSYFEVGTAATLDECKVHCLQAAVCVGVDFGTEGGQCKLWKRAAGIGASAQETGRECHRFLGIGVSYSQLEGFAFAGGEVLVGSMAVGEAKAKCVSLPGCKGFTYEDAAVSSGSLVEARFKSEWAAPCRGWTSFRVEPSASAVGAIEQQSSKEPPAQLAKLGSDLFDQFEKLSTAIAKGTESRSEAAPAQRSPQGNSGEGHLTPQAVQKMIEGALKDVDKTHDQKLSAETVREMISKALGSDSGTLAATKTAGRPEKQSDDDGSGADEAHLLASSWRHEEKRRKHERRNENRQVKLREQEKEHLGRREENEEQERRHKREVSRLYSKDVRKEELHIEEEQQREAAENGNAEKYQKSAKSTKHHVDTPDKNRQDDDMILESAMQAAEEAAKALSKFQADEVPTGDTLKAELKDLKKAVAAAEQAAALVSKSQAEGDFAEQSAEGDDETSARAEKITKIARLGTSLFKKIATLGSRITSEQSWFEDHLLPRHLLLEDIQS